VEGRAPQSACAAAAGLSATADPAAGVLSAATAAPASAPGLSGALWLFGLIAGSGSSFSIVIESNPDDA
jgi:hypothetical protein